MEETVRSHGRGPFLHLDEEDALDPSTLENLSQIEALQFVDKLVRQNYDRRDESGNRLPSKGNFGYYHQAVQNIRSVDSPTDLDGAFLFIITRLVQKVTMQPPSSFKNCLELNQILSSVNYKSSRIVQDFLVALFELLKTNSAVWFRNLDYHMRLAGFWQEEPMQYIKAEIERRREVHDLVINFLTHFFDPQMKKDPEIGPARKRLINVLQYPFICYQAIVEFKNGISGKANIEKFNYCLKQFLLEVPILPVILQNKFKDICLQPLTLTLEADCMPTMMTSFENEVFKGIYYSMNDLDKKLIQLAMRDYCAYENAPITPARKMLALQLKIDVGETNKGFVVEVFADEYEKATNGTLDYFQVLGMETETPLVRIIKSELNLWEPVESVRILEAYINKRLHNPKEWLDELENPRRLHSDLFDSTVKADIFYQCLWKFRYEDKWSFHVGFPLFILQKFIRTNPFIREQLSAKIIIRKIGQLIPSTNFQEANALLFDSANSFMDSGSLLFYYERLKQFLKPSQLNRIQKRLCDRKEAESVFSNFFCHPFEINENRGMKTLRPFFTKASQVLPDFSKKFPFGFFHSFATAYKFAAHTANFKMQSYITELFGDALQNGPDELRTCFNSSKWPKQSESFKEELYYILKTGTEHTPLELTDLFTKPWEELVLQRWRSKCTTFEKSAVKSLKQIGAGGYGQAYLVEVDKMASQLVAKYFNSWNYQLISGEIECLLKNQFNPHVVQLYGCIIGDGRFQGILTEFCKGGSLDGFILDSGNKYAQADIARWACHAASGLLYLHENSIVHKDVNPKNMFLDASHEDLKIGDLGISKVTVRNMQKESKSPQRLNTFSTNSYFGTEGYNAPEVREQSENYSAAIDVFGLGRSVWQMVYRLVPTDRLVEMSESNPKCPELQVIKVFVDEELWNFEKTMMAEAVEERPSMLGIYDFFKRRQFKPIQDEKAGRKVTRRPTL